MSKALMGTHVPSDSLRLLDEVRVLRQRVAELEAALEQARRTRDARADTTSDPAPAPTTVDAAFDRQPATT